MANSTPSDDLKLGTIFKEYGATYRSNHNLPTQHRKVMEAITKCRTSELGYIKYQCDNNDCSYLKGELKFVGQTAYLRNRGSFQELLDKLYAKKWNTYCKKTVRGAKKVLEYLGRYTYRVAISNHRLVKFEENKVTFRWWDNRDDVEKLMTLNVEEFIRRFLLHVLPSGYFKIRYYGILASRNLKTKLKRCQL